MNFRLRFRYGLRTLFVIFTLLAVSLGYYIERARRQRNAAEQIQSLNGDVYYERHLKNGNPAAYGAQQLAWDQTNLRLDLMGRIKVVWITTDKSWDLGAVNWSATPHLEQLHILNSELKSLQHLSSLRSLKKLCLFDCQLPREEFCHLAEFHSLESLDLSLSNVTDADIAYITTMPKLRELHLIGTDLTGASIPYLVQMKNLKELSISRVGFSRAEFSRLVLELPDCRIQP